ncbi:MAG TPA: type II secretion system F family protein [Micromonosporaceae bacterium]|jgi:Flp pilus assembly protein TadB
MSLVLIAFIGGVLWIGGAVALIVGMVGTTKPAGPPSASDNAVSRFWNGPGRTAAARRRHRLILVAGVVAGILAYVVTKLPIAGLLVAAAVPGAPWLFTVGNAERDRIDQIEAIGEWARRLKDISAVGTGLQQAIVASSATAPHAIADDVRDLAVRLQAGLDAREALMLFADAIGDPVCDQVVAALILHLSDRGDRLGEVLIAIAGAASAEVATRREVEAKRTQSRFGVKFLTITTVLALAYGIVRPSYMAPYRSPVGQFVMALLALLFIGVLLWVRKMSQPEPAPRFLNTPGQRTGGQGVAGQRTEATR